MSRVLVLAAAALVAAAALAGCASDGNEDPLSASAVLTVRIPMGAASEDSGIQFAVDQPAPQDPDRIRWINQDVVTHTIMGMGDASSAPAGPAPASPASPASDSHDGHGDHGHGAAINSDPASGMMFSFALPPGESVEVPIDVPGVLQVHCTNHPWLESQWWNGGGEFLLARPFWVQVDRDIARVNATGDTAAQEETTLAWPLPGPNLKRVEVLLSWNDSEDDTPVGDAANPPDTLSVEIIDPSGAVVASASLEAREGALVASFDAPGRQWPAIVAGESREKAVVALDESHPSDWSLAGDWSVLVRVDAAPGVLPGAPSDLPGADGHQAWTLVLLSEHERITLLDKEPQAGPGTGHGDHDEHGGHQH